MKIAIVGKICSGKTYISNQLVEKYNMKRYAFADKIKELARDLFDMKQKDRKLLQTLGEKIKEIDQDIWIKYLIRQMKNETNIIIDDLRFINELEYLKKNNFSIIKIKIDRNTQIQRIKNLYTENYENHIKNLDHISETELDHYKDFDLVVNSDENTLQNIVKFIVNKYYV